MTLFAVLLCCLVHPYHRSLAEVQWNQQTQRYEVALRVEPRDLDIALSDHFKRRVALDQLDESAANKMLKDYVCQHLRLTRPEETDSAEAVQPASAEAVQPAAVAPTHWVGHEVDDRGKFVWLYFEWTPPAGSPPLWLENRLFMKSEPTHISTVVFTDLEERPAVVFTKPHSRQPIPARTTP